MEALERIKERGDVDFTVGDFDSMPYLLAVGKVRPEKSRRWHELNVYHSAQEILRVHPPAVDIRRVSEKDDVVPLATPVVGVSGKVYNELLIPAGTIANISTIGHNL